MKERFEDFNMRPATAVIVNQAIVIIKEYAEAKLSLTLRQLYYQFVARGLIENTDRSYKNLGRIITKARMAGLINWRAIEDRGRNATRVWGDHTPEDVLDGIEQRLILDPWLDQQFYVEVWIEKEALLGVIEKPCDNFRVTRLACKGYLSASTLWEASKRMEHARDRGKKPVIIHLGDHDPSGIDMTRDNGDRAKQLSWGSVEVERIALNFDQVEEHNPPPNPTKMSDSRAAGYIEEFGRQSWELDALEPREISRLVKEAIQRRITRPDDWSETMSRESDLRNELIELGENWEAVSEFLSNL